MATHNTLGSKTDTALRPDAQAFDEVRIVTLPRYKTSGLSGDEWRISARIEFYRKGVLRHKAEFRDVEAACGFAWAEYQHGISEGNAYFAGDGVTCDQEGCSAPKTVTYLLKQKVCREGHKEPPYKPTLRHFCEEHKRRGDCGLDDADDNYEVFS